MVAADFVAALSLKVGGASEVGGANALAVLTHTEAGKTEAAKTLKILRRSSEAGAAAPALSCAAAPGPPGSSAFTASAPTTSIYPRANPTTALGVPN